ncbi:MAG: PEPxxWA-CTERM sorting domain-containing protein [Chakrabartia sp.]
MKKYFAIAAASFLAISSAHATTAITGFSGGSTFGGFSSDETVGFTFSTSSNLSVTALGWFAQNGAVNASHQVGVWNAAGTLLGSATVAPGVPVGADFLFTSLTPFTLASGQQYFIGGRDLINDGDSYVTSVSGLTVSPQITFLGSAVSTRGSGFAFPSSINNITTGGRFGPNFEFTDLGTGAVPEPATWAMMLAGFGMIGGAMRSRKTKVSVRYV